MPPTSAPTEDGNRQPDPPARRPTAAIFAPSPLLTITIEHDTNRADEVHLHPGGQGFWIARMLTALDVHTQLCAPFGGEVGKVLKALIADEGIDTPAGAATAGNGVYVHDRRDGERVPLANMPPAVLSRHQIDDLFGVMLAAGIAADVTVLGGPATEQVVPADIYRRLAADLRALHKTVVADLSGDALTAALAGGITVLKVSHEDLIADGRAAGGDPAALIAALLELACAGAEHVVLSHGGDGPTLALIDGEPVEMHAPRMKCVDHHGAGDCMTAALAAALAAGDDIETALRLAAGAAASNVTRKGLGTGNRHLIKELAQHVTIKPLDTAPG